MTEEETQAACMHSCILCKTIISSPSTIRSGLDHLYDEFEVSFDILVNLQNLAILGGGSGQLNPT